LEWLLSLAQPGKEPAESASLTLHEAMRKVLGGVSGRMMRAGDLAAAIEARQLYRMRDGRPVEPQQVHARVGHYRQLFAREGTFIKLIDKG
jgi:hypothetical protein